MSPDAKEVLDLHRRWGHLEVSKDRDSWMAIVSENAVLQPPGAPAITGTAAIREFAGAFFEMPIGKMDVGEAEVVLADSHDLALIHGEIQFGLDDPNDGPSEQLLKFMALWAKEGGEWRMRANGWSANTEP